MPMRNAHGMADGPPYLTVTSFNRKLGGNHVLQCSGENLPGRYKTVYV